MDLSCLPEDVLCLLWTFAPRMERCALCVCCRRLYHAPRPTALIANAAPPVRVLQVPPPLGRWDYLCSIQINFFPIGEFEIDHPLPALQLVAIETVGESSDLPKLVHHRSNVMHLVLPGFSLTATELAAHCPRLKSITCKTITGLAGVLSTGGLACLDTISGAVLQNDDLAAVVLQLEELGPVSLPQISSVTKDMSELPHLRHLRISSVRQASTLVDLFHRCLYLQKLDLSLEDAHTLPACQPFPALSHLEKLSIMRRRGASASVPQLIGTSPIRDLRLVCCSPTILGPQDVTTVMKFDFRFSSPADGLREAVQLVSCMPGLRQLHWGFLGPDDGVPVWRDFPLRELLHGFRAQRHQLVELHLALQRPLTSGEAQCLAFGCPDLRRLEADTSHLLDEDLEMLARRCPILAARQASANQRWRRAVAAALRPNLPKEERLPTVRIRPTPGKATRRGSKRR
eukprot:TRINITY_DN15773_c0_g1_i1.p1 TRINITY_DN15773_c0_g1~~TRINITY_DN15773_c0_g1_i1.p1  ORF type:complete len:458 (+),score=38.74 TRINITY_DN15773_c0_g1_i1:352-1725(+)